MINRRLVTSLPLVTSYFLAFAGSAFANVALTLNPENANVQCPQTIEMVIAIDTTENETDGARSIITFDPKILQVTKIDPPAITPFYPLLPAKDFTTVPGQMTIVGLANSAGPFPKGRGNFATVTFKTIGAGTSKVDFVKNTEGANNGSTVIGHATSKDILEETHSASYTVTGSCVSAAPTSPPAPANLPAAGDDSFVYMVGILSTGLILSGLLGYKFYR